MTRRGRTELNKEGNLYFITTTVMNFDNILTLKDKYTSLIIDSLNFLISEHNATLTAYVIMPSHIHLLIYIPKGESISDFMRDFKKYTSSAIFKEVQKDRDLMLLDRLRNNSIGGKWKVWMDRFDSQIILSDKFFKQKINYIHYNPVKAGLVNDMTEWKYSSARNYYLNDHSTLEVTTGYEWKKT
ncbi:MAG: transposase [Ignavibacteria bacterium]|nr:transposase [Bacteroidota bacterium]MBL7129430.1 transposase [Ignavibacteria bacterium]